MAEFLYNRWTEPFKGQAPLRERLFHPPFLVTMAMGGVMLHLNRDAFGWMLSNFVQWGWNAVVGSCTGGALGGGGGGEEL